MQGLETRPIAKAERRTAVAIPADFHRIEAEREAVRVQITDLARQQDTRRDRHHMQELIQELRSFDTVQHYLEMEAAALVLWP